MIDLHTHSTFSDGSLSPTQLVDLAVEEGVTALALTDHDTTDGIEELLATARRRQAERAGAVDAIPGVELSVAAQQGSMHMLGYRMTVEDGRLQSMLQRIREGRATRNTQIHSRLAQLGVALPAAQVQAAAGDGVVGRPHFAQALVAAGVVATPLQAFKRYLARGKPAYCERYRPSAEEAIQAIRGAGGVAVLAHPVTLDMTFTRLRKELVHLVGAGLQGIEAYYSEHTEAQEAVYRDMARDFGIVATGGSDFHGDANPLIRLGRGFGRLRVPEEAVAALRRAAGA